MEKDREREREREEGQTSLLSLSLSLSLYVLACFLFADDDPSLSSLLSLSLSFQHCRQQRGSAIRAAGPDQPRHPSCHLLGKRVCVYACLRAAMQGRIMGPTNPVFTSHSDSSFSSSFFSFSLTLT